MKTKHAKDTLQASRKNTPVKLRVDKGTNMVEFSKIFAKKKNIEVYSTRSETKAAFAERAIQSFKHIIYRYIEKRGKKCIHKLPQFASTMTCRVSRSIGKSPRDVKDTEGIRNKIQSWRPSENFKEEYSVPKHLQITIYRRNFSKFWQYTLKHLLHTSSMILKKKKFWDNFMK